MRVKIIDFDVRQASRIEGLSGYTAVELLFRSGRDPLGRARISCNGDFLEYERLSPILEKLPPPAARQTPAEPLPTVTVAVCTRNRLKELAVALNSLARQVYKADEILVIDNGCRKEVRALVERLLPQARYIPEQREGLDFARNRAISVATGEILAFLDDDAVADSFWVQSLAECFAGFAGAGAVTGLILPLELETDAQELFEANSGYARGFTRRVLPQDRARRFGWRLPLVAESIGVGSGCNMAFKTEVLKNLNGFDEALDTGAPLPGGGDLDMFYRVMRAGYQHIYEPRALVRHCHRRSLADAQAQLSGHYRSLSAFLMKSLGIARGRDWFGIFFFLLWRLSKVGFRILRRPLGRDALPVKLLVRMFISGLAGVGSYHASRRRIRSQTQYHGGARPGLIFQLGELWRYRELIWNLTARDLKVKYQRSWLGFLWTLMNPLITLGVLVTVFSYIVRLPMVHYWAFLISGFFAWNFFSQTLNGGVQAAVGNAHLSRSAYFPQEVLVISAAFARLIEFLGEMAIVMVFLSVFHHRGVPLSYIMILLLIFLLFLLVLGVSLFVVTLAVYYYDAVQAVSLATFALFYISPVFYSIDLVPENMRVFFLFNPIALVLSLFHDALYRGKMPDLDFSLITSGIALAFAFAGYAVFNRKKREFAEII